MIACCASGLLNTHVTTISSRLGYSRTNARGSLHSHSTPVRACSCNRTHHHPLRPPVRRAAGTMTWRVLWSVAGGHECPPLIRLLEQGLLLCLLLCFCGVSPGWPGLGATGVGCRPCWGLRTLRACESANETGLYLPSSRLAYPPTSQAPEAPTATPSAQTLEDPTSPATGTDGGIPGPHAVAHEPP